MANFPEYTEAQPGLQDHPLFSGAQSVGMISGESPRWLHKLPLSQQDQVQRFGHQMLGSDLKHMGLRAEEIEGKYGSPEKSYMVYGATHGQLNHLAGKYGQDSVLYAPSGHKTAKIHYSDISEDEQGNSLKGHYRPSLGTYNYHPVEQPEDFFSKIPNKGYVRLNFDWDKPAINSEPSKEITKAELKYGLLKALKKAMGNETLS
jgi:hypothetical protein